MLIEFTASIFCLMKRSLTCSNSHPSVKRVTFNASYRIHWIFVDNRISLYRYNHRSILNEGSRGQGVKDSSEGFQANLGRENRMLYILTMHNDMFSIEMDYFHP